MEDHENFRDLYAKLVDIVNSSFNLDEPIPNSKVIGKILRSLLERLKEKVIVVEESKDVDTFKLDQLVGSLRTFEMTLTSPRKSKRVYDTECPSRKKGKKAMEVYTWNDLESYQLSSERESNES